MAGDLAIDSRRVKLSEIDDFDTFFDTFGKTPQKSSFFDELGGVSKQSENVTNLEYMDRNRIASSVLTTDKMDSFSGRSKATFERRSMMKSANLFSENSTSPVPFANRKAVMHEAYENTSPSINVAGNPFNGISEQNLHEGSNSTFRFQSDAHFAASNDISRWSASGDEDSNEALGIMKPSFSEKNKLKNLAQNTLRRDRTIDYRKNSLASEGSRSASEISGVSKRKPPTEPQPGSSNKQRSLTLKNQLVSKKETSPFDSAKQSTGTPGSRLKKVDAYPFHRSRTVAAQFRLPRPTEYNYRGQLYRLKGRWKKKWVLEWFIAEHDVLMTCAQEEPFLLKLCIPLRNIQRIELAKVPKKLQGTVLDIRYIEAGKKNQEVLSTLRCRAINAAEAKFCIESLLRLRERALREGKSDLVSRSNAEVAIRKLHDSVKNGGLYQLVLRLFSISARHNESLLRNAMELLKWNSVTQKMTQQQEMTNSKLLLARSEAEAAKALGKTELVEAKRLASLGTLIQKLCCLADSKRHLALLHFQHNASTSHTMKIAKGMHEVLLNAVVVEHEKRGKANVQWRKQRMKHALQAPFLRAIKWAWLQIEMRGDCNLIVTEARASTLKCLIFAHQSHRNKAIAMALMRWKSAATLYACQQQALSAVLIDIRNWQCHLAIRRWVVGCTVRSQRDIQAVMALSLTVKKKLSQVLSSFIHQSDVPLLFFCISAAFGFWSRRTVEIEQEDALQIASNYNMINDQIVAAYNHVPRDRACHLLAIAFQKFTFARRAQALHRMLRAAAEGRLLHRNLMVAISLFQRLNRKRLVEGFYGLLKFNSRYNNFSSKRLRGVLQLTSVLRAMRDRRTARARFFISCKPRAALSAVPVLRGAPLLQDVPNITHNKPSESSILQKQPESTAINLNPDSSKLHQLPQVLLNITGARLAKTLRSLAAHKHGLVSTKGLSRTQRLECLSNFYEQHLRNNVAGAFFSLASQLPQFASVKGLSSVKTSIPLAVKPTAIEMEQAKEAESFETQLIQAQMSAKIAPRVSKDEPVMPSRHSCLLLSTDFESRQFSDVLNDLFNNATDSSKCRFPTLTLAERDALLEDIDQARKADAWGTSDFGFQSDPLIIENEGPSFWKRSCYHPTIRKLRLKRHGYPSNAHIKLSTTQRSKLLTSSASLQPHSIRGIPNEKSITDKNETPHVCNELSPTMDLINKSPFVFRPYNYHDLTGLEFSPYLNLKKTFKLREHLDEPTADFPYRPSAHTIKVAALQRAQELAEKKCHSSYVNPLSAIELKSPRVGQLDDVSQNNDYMSEQTGLFQQNNDSSFDSTLPTSPASYNSYVNNYSEPSRSDRTDCICLATGESPDIDIIRDFVFDDINAIRAASSIDVVKHMRLAEESLNQDDALYQRSFLKREIFDSPFDAHDSTVKAATLQQPTKQKSRESSTIKQGRNAFLETTAHSRLLSPKVNIQENSRINKKDKETGLRDPSKLNSYDDKLISQWNARNDYVIERPRVLGLKTTSRNQIQNTQKASVKAQRKIKLVLAETGGMADVAIFSEPLKKNVVLVGKKQ